MRCGRLIGMVLVGGVAVIVLAVVPAALTSSLALGSDLAGCSERIVNGGFEQGGLGWQQQPSPPLPAGVTLIDSFYPHTLNFGADLAGRNGANDRLSQQVTLPANATGIALDLWWALFTEETAGTFDRLQVALYEPSSGALIATLLEADNTSATDWAWNLASFDLTSYAGRTVVLRFTATNDTAGSPTIFFVDDVSILACTAPPTSTPTSTTPSTTASRRTTAQPERHSDSYLHADAHGDADSHASSRAGPMAGVLTAGNSRPRMSIFSAAAPFIKQTSSYPAKQKGDGTMKIKLVLRNFVWLIAAFALVGGALAPALPAAAEAETIPFDVRFTGVIVTAGGAGETWTVGPQTVATDARTVIVLTVQPAAAGLWAEVDALRQADGSLLARRITVLPEAVRLRGVVSTRPEAAAGVGDWVIAGVPVKVTADTKISQRGGPVGVGNWVEAVMEEEGGVFSALRIVGIETQDAVEVTGEIRSFDAVSEAASWVLSGITLKLDADTLVSGEPAVGLIGHGAAQLQADGSLLAQRLRVLWNEKPDPKPGRPTFVNFNGKVEKLPETGLWGEWVVDGKTVKVTPATRINQQKGLVKVGAEVNVVGHQADGKIMAMQITVLRSDAPGGRRVVFLGRIEALPEGVVVGAWKVGGRDVMVTAQTTLLPKDFTPKVGMWALVEGLRPETGPIVASQIRLRPAGPHSGFDPAEIPELTEE